MGQIFISYSSRDSEFAKRLVKSLEEYFDVWMDQSLEGGMKWEQMIQSAIEECQVFLVIVSQASNESEWVARETILAEQLKKPRIPV